MHLGNHSYSILKSKYPQIDHRILLHHVYDTIYTSIQPKIECCKKLNLNPNNIYILCFGEFRADEERNLIIQLAKQLKNEKVKILAPSFCLVPKRRNLFYVIMPLLKYLYYKFKYSNIKMEKYFVDDNQLMYYYGASSISLIHRLKILNSGNVPLGFLMKNIVVGPNVGNVGEWLKETNNPTFNPHEEQTLIDAIWLAIRNNKVGEDNYKYAMKNLTTSIISSKLYYYYKDLLKNNI